MTHYIYKWLITDDTAARAAWTNHVPNVILQDDAPIDGDYYWVGTPLLTEEQNQSLTDSGYFTIEIL